MLTEGRKLRFEPVSGTTGKQSPMRCTSNFQKLAPWWWWQPQLSHAYGFAGLTSRLLGFRRLHFFCVFVAVSKVEEDMEASNAGA